MKIDIEEVELCLDMHYLTEIVNVQSMNHEPGDGLTLVRARGAVAAIARQQYVRPMFEVMPAPRSAPFLVRQVPCASCGDFSRSWNCEAHTYWSPIGDEDDLTGDVVVPGIRRMLANGDSVPMISAHDSLVSMYQEIVRRGVEPVFPRESVRTYLDGLQDISIDFTITEEGMAALNEALASGPRRRIQPSLHSLIEQFGLDNDD